MAALAGMNAKVMKNTATVAELGEWSIDLELDTQEDTSLGDNWKTYLPGLKGWSGSMSGRFDMTDTTGQKALQDAYLNGTLVTDGKFYVDSTHYYSTPAGSGFLITGLSVSAAVDGMVEISIDFQGSGQLQYT